MRKAFAATAVVAATVLATNPGVASALPSKVQNKSQCGPQWTVSTVGKTFGLPLENLGFDGRGGLLISRTAYAGLGEAEIDRVSPDGTVQRQLKVNGPGAIAARGNTVYFNTGLNAVPTAIGVPTDGTIDTYNLDTGKRSTWATGLTAPDGMTLLPNGDAVTTTVAGLKMGVYLVRHQDPHRPVPYPLPHGVSIPLPNGVSISNDGRTLYVVSAFGLPQARIFQLSLTDPSRKLPTIPTGTPSLEEVAVAPDGTLYGAGEVRDLGSVIQIDPKTGTNCLIASGITLASSTRFGAGPGWDPHSLYTVGFDGVIRRLTPPTRN